MAKIGAKAKKKSATKRKPAVKRAAPKKRSAVKRAAPKRSAVKRGAAHKRSAVKKRAHHPQYGLNGHTPVNKAMVFEVRDELKQDISQLRYETKAEFKKVDARFNEVDARFKEVDARFKEVDARFDKVDARLDKMDARFNKMDARLDEMSAQISEIKSLIHEMAARMEVQDQRNQVVLDGYDQLYKRQDRYERELSKKLDQTFRNVTNVVNTVMTNHLAGHSAKE